MLGLFNAFAPTQFFTGSAAPIGVDLGMESIRLAQVAPGRENPQLIAAASTDVPSYLAADPVAYAESLTRTLKDLVRGARFQGRKVILGLPSPLVHLLHLRLDKTDPESLRHTLPAEVAGKIPFDPVSAMLRHHTVGDVYTNDGLRQEVICTAARHDMIELLLQAVERARLEVIGLVAAPIAVRDCFTYVFSRQSDIETTYCFIDLGRSATRTIIARQSQLYFARSIPVGCEHLDQAVAEALGVEPEEAKLLRHQMSEQSAEDTAHQEPRAHAPEPQATGSAQGTATAAATLAPPQASRTSIATDLAVTTAMGSVVEQLADELQRCRRYHEASFPGVLVDKLVFIGGGAVQRKVCQAIAQRLHVAARIGDPIAKLIDENDDRPDFLAAGIDRRRSQPAWAVACGLSLGAM